MAQISNITLPNGETYNLKGSVYTVVGTQTAATGSWTGVLDTIDALYDGLTIMYYLPYAGSGNATLNLTLKNNVTTGAIPCYYNANSRLTTHYAAQTMLLMTYWSAGSIKIAGTATTENRWYAHYSYNTNTTYSAMSQAEAWTGTATASRVIRADYLKQILANLGGTGLVLTYNATDGIVLDHENSVTAQNTEAVYPIKIDAQGHISSYGTAITPLTASSSLDASKLTGTVPTSVLPSYVDDVLEYTAKANFPVTGEEGKIYVDKTTNLTWRWGGSAYIEISPSLALGSTASTAAKGNHTHSFTPAGTIAVQTAGATNNTLKPVTAKTVVTGATFNTVVTGGTTTNIPNISVTPTTIKSIDTEGTAPSLTITEETVGTGLNKQVSTAAGATSIATLNAASTNANGVSSDNCTLTIAANVTTLLNNNTALTTKSIGSASDWSAGSMPTTEEIEVGSASAGAAIKAYTTLTTGTAGSATTGDSVTLGNAVTVKTGDAVYKFTGTAGTTNTPA